MRFDMTGGIDVSARQAGELWLDGKLVSKVGTGTLALEGIAAGSHSLEFHYGKGLSEKQSLQVRPGRRSKIVFTKGIYAIGDTGSAGGIIFYDKGRMSEGWRYLEAAPSDQSPGIQWNNSRNIGI